MRAAVSRLKKEFLLGASIIWIVAATGCVTSESFVVSLQDGRVFRSPEEPVLNPKTGYYMFRDRQGRDVLLREKEIASIVADAD